MHPKIEKEKRFVANTYAPLDVVINRGKDIYLWDTTGKKYIDMMSAYSAVSLGHSHPKIIKTLAKQSKKLCVTSRAFHTDNLAPLMEKLCALSGLDMGIPMNTGAEAVETAIKAARLWGYKKKGIEKNKAKILVAKNNFHGRTTTIISFSSEELYKNNFGPLTPGFKEIKFGDKDELEKSITKDVCAFLVEPMQGEGGIIIPDKGWLREVQKICKKHNVLLILDEVQTGLGRTGEMFAFQHEIDRPDGLILGKALGGGALPISVFLGKKEIMELFTPGTHGSTFGGNPLAASVAIKALEVLKNEKLVENSKNLGSYFLTELKKIKHPAIKDIRGRGLWIGIELDPKIISGKAFCQKLKEKGVLTKETHETVIRLAPPLTIKKSAINRVLNIIENLLHKT